MKYESFDRKDQRHCGTCKNWCGRREPDFSVTIVQYPSINEYARCLKYYGRTTPALQSCNDWEQQYK